MFIYKWKIFFIYIVLDLIFQLYEKPDELEVATQTDHYVDRPATPIFYPEKIGQDASTQIEAGDVSSHIKLFIYFII